MAEKVYIAFSYDTETANPTNIYEAVPKEVYEVMSLDKKMAAWQALMKSTAAFEEKNVGRNISELETVAELGELFAQHNGRFTSFVLGSWLEWMAGAKEGIKSYFSNPAIEVGSHSYTHRTYKTSGDQRTDATRAKLSPGIAQSEAYEEIRKANEIIEKVLGRKPIGLRTPMGNIEPFGPQDSEILDALAKNGMLYVSSWLKAKQREPNTIAAQPFMYPTHPVMEIPGVGFYDVHHSMPTRLLVFGDENTWSERERADYHIRILEDALKAKGEAIFVPLVCHPWDVRNYDPEFNVHKEILGFCKENSIGIVAYEDIFRLVNHNI